MERSLQSYLNRALQDDISDSQLMNVIRIILNLDITNHGVGGDEHYATVAMNERKAKKNKLSNVEFVEPELDEHQEVEEIAALFEQDL